MMVRLMRVISRRASARDAVSSPGEMARVMKESLWITKSTVLEPLNRTMEAFTRVTGGWVRCTGAACRPGLTGASTTENISTGENKEQERLHSQQGGNT